MKLDIGRRPALLRMKHGLAMAQLLVVCAFAGPDYSLIPQPVQLEPGEGFFEMTDQTAILVDPSTRPCGDYLADMVAPAAGFRPAVEESVSSDRPRIVLKINDTLEQAGEEGYHVKVTPEGVLVEARRPAGIFYGIQTLRQLLPAEIFSSRAAKEMPWRIPAVEITDRPRFAWRGLHLDVSRHFMPVEFIKKYIDLMAMHKMNKFHWHLTDNQGWRIEIKKYPNLTEIGSKRDNTYVRLLAENPTLEYDGNRFGGYYTQDQIREVVQYAQERFVEIIPEIEMPGHSRAARMSYPWLTCTGKGSEYCPGKEEAFAFLEDVLTEVMDLFPSQYIHIGGDEVGKADWKSCPHCKARMEKENIAGVEALQPYFTSRIEKFVTQKGRRMVGWDEILEGKLDQKSVVMCWRDEKYATEAAEHGHDVILTPTTHCYFDYGQEDKGEAGGGLPLKTVYSFQATPAGLTAEQQKHILGVQACLWTESVPVPAQAEFMVYPRGCALAEVGWTPLDKKDYADFHARLKKHLKRLDFLGVNYRRLDN